MLPTRLIVEISNITDPAIATFFRDNGYKIEGENQSVGRMAYFLRVAFVVCLLIGIVIFALSFAILVLSIYLILQKKQRKNRQPASGGLSPTSRRRVLLLADEYRQYCCNAAVGAYGIRPPSTVYVAYRKST